MENTTLVKDIRESFEELKSEASLQTVKEGITGIVRSVNRIKTENSDLNIALRAISADLMKLYSNQVQYSDLRNKSENPGLKVKPELDSSFFDALDILKEELFRVLEKL